MGKFVLIFVCLVVLGQTCNFQKLEKIDRLMEKFLDLVDEKKYKYKAALLSYELMNYNQVETDDLEDLTQTLEVSSDGFLGARSRKCDHAIYERHLEKTVMACQNKAHLNGVTFVTSPYGRGGFAEAVCCIAK
ncbi:hypothetical protein ACHWQZ_G004870 [Mnemiopsis leidyi]